MSKMAKRGRELYESGYSCSEATWLAFNEDLPEEELNFGLHLAGGFSGGLSSGKLCGAISGIVLSLGRRYGRNMGEERNEILKEKVQKLLNHVDEIYKSHQCEELRPEVEPKAFCANLVEKLLEYGEKELLD